jgi:hypothetical protein
MPLYLKPIKFLRENISFQNLYPLPIMYTIMSEALEVSIRNLRSYKFNIFKKIYLCCLFFLGIHTFSFEIVEAIEFNAEEFNIDIEEFASFNTMQRIDCFIDLCFEHQNTTGKKFKYNNFLKETYSHLAKEGIHVAKQIKKDIKLRIIHK